MSNVPFWGWLVLAIVVGASSGFLFGTQPSVNGHLSRNLEHPLQASIISFATGLLILVVLAVLMGVFPPRFQVSLRELPWWSWGGGAIGVLLVTASLVFVPRIGSLPWHAVIIAGQLSAALLLDHFGWLGNSQQPLTGMRMLGAMLLVAGVVVIFWAKRESSGEATARMAIRPAALVDPPTTNLPPGGTPHARP